LRPPDSENVSGKLDKIAQVNFQKAKQLFTGGVPHLQAAGPSTAFRVTKFRTIFPKWKTLKRLAAKSAPPVWRQPFTALAKMAAETAVRLVFKTDELPLLSILPMTYGEHETAQLIRRTVCSPCETCR
jgi:hypothetical protein